MKKGNRTVGNHKLSQPWHLNDYYDWQQTREYLFLLWFTWCKVL